MSKKSSQIAVGGVFSALCLTLMFLTGVLPFLTYAVPMLAGAALVAVVVENGRKTAVLVYVAVSLLSLLIVADKQAVMLYIAFFGYYPILKQSLDKRKILGYAVKFGLFNLTMVGGYYLLIYVLALPDLVSEMGDLGRWGSLLFLLTGNLLLLVFDWVLTKYTALYIRWFRPTFLRR